ncbi:MAG: ABC transporter ATP-binding protein [Ruminococcus sp.]|nr:ABC transporter ATP-binding protein [Ruminococcus sp.]
MSVIFKYLRKKEWSMAFVSILFIVGQVWLDLKLPDYMSEITMLVQTPGSEMSEIWTAGGKMLLCALGSVLLSVITGYFASKIAAGYSRRLRSLIFNKVSSFSMEEINMFSTPSLITRSTNDVMQLQMLIAMGLQVMIKGPILAVWAICKILDKNWQWTAATGGALLVLFILIFVALFFAFPKFKKLQILNDNLNRVVRENLTGIRVVRAYNAEDYQQEKFEKANEELTHTHLFTGRVMGIMMPGMSTIMSGLPLAIYWIGAVLINNSADMQEKAELFSNMVVFSSYAIQVVMAFVMMVMIFILAPRASVSAQRINEVLNTVPKINDGSKLVTDTAVKGEIEFRNVSFKYPDAADYVLRNISFTAKKGETVAFIGSTGSGKSTLVNLVPRFYDATEGEVLVDGENVKNYRLEELYNKLGYVSQKTVMFSGTVSSNVAYGENGDGEYTAENVKRAVEIAQAGEFVENLKNTYDAQIAQGGTNLSGGQKQRLSIARAICRNPEIYIFDDSFSALDYKTDRVLRTELKKAAADKTMLIVAQRIGTIRDADKIIVLDEGEIAGMGTHSELMKNCEVYQQIALSQLSKEELENE